MIHVQLPSWSKALRAKTAPDGEPARFRAVRGGRGGGKSWTVATMLVLRALEGVETILCAREHQNSLADSSKKLIEDTIERMGFGPSGSGFFEFREKEIRGRNGSVFKFRGLHGRDQAIRSVEGITIVWVEEASAIGQSTLNALTPTIRAHGSELWFTYNPQLASDPVDAKFRDPENRPKGSIVIDVQWRDNPWFPIELRREMEYDRARDLDKYLHVWEGGFDLHSDARVFTRWQKSLFDSPANADFRYGVDWGFSKTDPTVLIRCFVGRWHGKPGEGIVIADPTGDCLFIDYEAHAFGCPANDLPALFAGRDPSGRDRWDNLFGYPGVPGASTATIHADNSDLRMIDHMQSFGFRMQAARKGQGSVREGIVFIQNYDIYVHPRCVRTIDELTHYRYKIDKHTGEITRQLPDRHDHLIDALRYAMEDVRRSGEPDLRVFSALPRVTNDLGGSIMEAHVPPWGDPIAHAQRQDEAANQRGLLMGNYMPGWR